MMDKFSGFMGKRVIFIGIAAALILWGAFWLFDGSDQSADRQTTRDDHQEATAAGHGKSPATAGHQVQGGRLITVADILERHVTALNADITAWEARDILKRERADLDRMREFYATDHQGRLVGKGTVVRLMAASDEEKIRDLMEKGPVSVTADMKIEAVSSLFTDIPEEQFPVVDTRGQLVGFVTSEAIAVAMKTGRPEPAEGISSAPHGVLAGSEPAAHDDGPAVSESDAHGGEKTPVDAHAEGAGKSAEAVHDSGTDHTVGGGVPPHAPPMTPATEPAGHEAPEEAHPPAHGDAAHGKEGAAHDAHPWPPPTPKIRGLAFVEASVAPLDYEINKRFWGWRPNDFIPTGDNVMNFQLGVLEVTRRISVVLQEKISRTGTIEAYDPSLENATNLLMIMPNRYWFPSAEGEYGEALAEIMRYHKRLETGRAGFYTRTDNLIPLLDTFELLLGSVEENLVKKKEKGGAPVTAFTADDYFFYAQGVMSAMYQVLYAVAVDFWPVMETRKVSEVLHDAIESCHHALEISPWVVTDADPSGILANHRANLAAPVSHARFFLGVLIKALST